MKSPMERFQDAYLMMAKTARYRPAAPSDGMGTALLTKEEADDPERLKEEARQYAIQFIKEEDEMEFDIGCTNYRTNRATVFIIEAARALCGVKDELAIDLLEMALKEIKRSQQERAP